MYLKWYMFVLSYVEFKQIKVFGVTSIGTHIYLIVSYHIISYQRFKVHALLREPRP